MTAIVKRFIAREVLLLISLIIICLLTYLVLFSYNLYMNYHIEATKNKVYALTYDKNKLLSQIEVKKHNRAWFYGEIISGFKIESRSADSLWNRINIALPKLEKRWNSTDDLPVYIQYKMGFTLTGFKDFLKKNAITSLDAANMNLYNTIVSEIKVLNNQNEWDKTTVFTRDKMKEFLIDTLFIVFTLLFLIRYLYYSAKWSIQILKS